MDTALCTRCHRDRLITDFSPSQVKSGRGWCRACFNEHARNVRAGIVPPRTTGACDVCGTLLNGRRRHARFCSSACSAKSWRQANPDGTRRNMLKSVYGITISDFESLFEAQGRSCAICACTAPSGTGWHIDHDHLTGKVRGILCALCNQGIGQLQHSPDILRAAIDYLRRTSG